MPGAAAEDAAARVAGEDPGAAWIRHVRAGEWEAAWRVSDRVLASHAGEPCWHLPRHEQWIWDGTPLDGKRVLIRCYHGLGDTLQFIRYAPLVKQAAAEVVVWAQPPLLPLLRTARGIDRLLPLHDGDVGIDYDVDVEVMELPHVFRTTARTLPADVPYLHVPPAPLAKNGRLAVGIAWKAGNWDSRRDVPFPLLAPLAQVPGVELHVLQRGSGLAQRQEGFGVVSGSDDPYVAARVMRALDLVITVDSMPAHLAGALGVPVWTLLHADPDWRWMQGRDDNPWYPTMRLFRQQRPGDWGPVIARVVEELRECVSAVRSRESAKVRKSTAEGR
ncbi:MAG: ADP-heptose--LPS heptosyltransferase [Gemmatimonadetes bacterium]|nr:ADP-heptose--LPS heptosyltransferase [Gemmatimonadota bacterium]